MLSSKSKEERDEDDCKWFGIGRCNDCRYPFIVVAEEVLEAYGARRTLYEKERKKSIQWRNRATYLEGLLGQALNSVRGTLSELSKLEKEIMEQQDKDSQKEKKPLEAPEEDKEPKTLEGQHEKKQQEGKELLVEG